MDQMIAKLGPLQLVFRELEMGGNNHHVSLCIHRPRFIIYAGIRPLEISPYLVAMTISVSILAHSGPRRLVDPIRPSSRSIGFETAV